MPIENSLSFRGLMTSPNNLGAGSEGALVVANNVTIRYPDVLEPRRGQEAVPDVVEPPTEIAQCQYVGTSPSGAYVVNTSTPHGYSNGQTVIVNTGTLDQPHTVTINGGVSTTAFTVVSPQNWPFPPYEYVFTYPLAGEPSFPVSQVSFFEDKVVLHSADLGKIKVLGEASTLTGEYLAADPDYRLKTAIAASTFYMATDKGVMALEDSTSTVPRLSGIAEPLAPTAAVVEDPTLPAPTIPGFLDPGKAVAYRVLFGYVDSHKAVHLGPPSVRTAVKNTSAGQASVTVIVPLLTTPTDAAGAIVEGTFVRIYRSVMADTEGKTSDELYLVNETVIDTTQYGVDDVLILSDTARQEFAVQSAPLYTNPTQGGLPNDAPPYARDLATWSEREWYANTEQPFSLTAQLIGVEGGGNPDIPATGLRVGDTVTIAGVTFTGAVSNDFATRQFLVWTAGPDAATNISNTLYWLALTVNQWAIDNPTTFLIRAYLEPVVFGDELLNFKVRFQRPSVDSTTNTAFTVKYEVLLSTGSVSGTSGNYTVTTTAPHNLQVGDYVRLYRLSQPNVITTDVLVEGPVTPTTFKTSSTYVNMLSGINRVIRYYGESVWTPDLFAGVAADNERRSDYVYYSLPGEPEAVSAANYISVGTRGKAIRRIIPQRDRLLVFKDEGTYAVYGDFPYQVSLVDDTMAILAPDSAVAIGSTVIALMEDGIMAVSDGGIQMISKVIDSTLKPYGAAPYRSTTRTAFGVAYESEKVFALFMPTLSGAGADYTARAYVFGLEPQAWTTWSFSVPRLCGRVDPFTDTAYYGMTASPYLVKDKNTSSTADYFDYNEAITSTVQWAATTLGAPHFTKQAREIHFHYRDVRQPVGATVTADYSLKTDIVTGGETVSAWPAGSQDFSNATIIGPAVLPLQYRKLVPQNVQRATYYTLSLTATTSNPGGYWALNGYSIVFEGTSERTGTVR